LFFNLHGGLAYDPEPLGAEAGQFSKLIFILSYPKKEKIILTFQPISSTIKMDHNYFVGGVLK
jgi:hypothetical protein